MSRWNASTVERVLSGAKIRSEVISRGLNNGRLRNMQWSAPKLIAPGFHVLLISHWQNGYPDESAASHLLQVVHEGRLQKIEVPGAALVSSPASEAALLAAALTASDHVADAFRKMAPPVAAKFDEVQGIADEAQQGMAHTDAQRDVNEASPSGEPKRI